MADKIQAGYIAIYTRQYDKAEIPVYVASPRGVWHTKTQGVLKMWFVRRLDLPRGASGHRVSLIVPEYTLKRAEVVMKEPT